MNIELSPEPAPDHEAEQSATPEPEKKIPFDPWANLETTGTNQVNVVPKPPSRVHFHKGRNEIIPSLPGLGKLQLEVGRIIRDNPEITEDKVIAIIEEGYRGANTPRGRRFDSSTIRRLVQENKTRQ